MDEWIKGFGALGVGGILAGLIFYFYRKDALEFAAELMKQRDVWLNLSNSLMQVIKENSAAITANTETIKALHRRDDRIEDILNELGFQFPHRLNPRKDPS
jgi:hypothetical protein